MLRSTTILLIKRFRVIGNQPHTFCFSTFPQTQGHNWSLNNNTSKETRYEVDQPIGPTTSRKQKLRHLIRELPDLGESKDAIYGALDAWVAWEENFPVGVVKNVLLSLEREKQWHRVVQVIKWMLSKGQSNTMGTYQQLIYALGKDNRAEEAHTFWMKKIGYDLDSVPWRACHLMISVYFKNGMFYRLVELFKHLETFDRKPPDKSIIQKVADAYEKLGLIDDKTRLLEKYKNQLSREIKDCDKKPRRRESIRRTLSRRPSSFSKVAEA